MSLALASRYTSDSAVVRQCSCSSLGCTVLTNPSMYNHNVHVEFCVSLLCDILNITFCWKFVYSVLVVAVQDGRS